MIDITETQKSKQHQFQYLSILMAERWKCLWHLYKNSMKFKVKHLKLEHWPSQVGPRQSKLYWTINML